MKLFLDDIRPAPQGEDIICVRNFRDCIFALETKEFEYISLDYSLGERFTGLNVLMWMYENQKFPQKLNIHSSFSYGVAEMKSYIKSHFPVGYEFTVKSAY